MTNKLVVYYSRTGTTKKVAKEIAKELGADIEELSDTQKREGFIGYMRSGYQAMKKKHTVLHPLKNKPKDYDMVIVGTPVWSGTLSVPVRTFLKEHKANELAFFAVSGDKKDQGIFRKLEEVSGKPVATLHFSTTTVKKGNIREKVKEFVEKLK